MLHFHFVSFAFCYNCIMSYLHFVTFAICPICILLHLHFVRFAFCLVCILSVFDVLLHLHFVTDSLGLIYLQMMHDSVSEVLSNHTVSHVLPWLTSHRESHPWHVFMYSQIGLYWSTLPCPWLNISAEIVHSTSFKERKMPKTHDN